jgi:CheY-like chemotaxis protein
MPNSPILTNPLKLNRRQCLRSLGLAAAVAVFPGLPAYEPAPGPREATDLVAWTAKNPILHVDDDVLLLRLVQAFYQRLKGWRVIVADDREQALEICREEPISLVVSDIMMPRMCGYEMLTRMKADRRMRHIPLMYLTARPRQRGYDRALALGAVDYITKPCLAHELVERVERALLAHGRWSAS